MEFLSFSGRVGSRANYSSSAIPAQPPAILAYAGCLEQRGRAQ